MWSAKNELVNGCVLKIERTFGSVNGSTQSQVLDHQEIAIISGQTLTIHNYVLNS